jgi:para-nitrobenzyl esterase
VQVGLAIPQGSLRGESRHGIAAFKGIPYAAAPFGPNRFLAPQPAPTWTGLRAATAFGPTAPKPPQRGISHKLLPDPDIPGDECLNLNIWTPELGAAGLPVLVWLHGGGFVTGSSSLSACDGSAFARDGIVCVAVNYRLGVDGFAQLEDAVPNRGLLDQLAALEWVQTNIAAFGGDPGNVTLAGESAGAMCAVTLLSMPQSDGLFRRLIAQSGAAHHVVSVDTAIAVTAKLAKALGVGPTAAAFAEVPRQVLIEAVNPVILAINAETATTDKWPELRRNGLTLKPVVDGEILQRRPIESLAAGTNSRVDVLIGTNSDEQRLWVVPPGAEGENIEEPALRSMIAGIGADPDEVTKIYAAEYPDYRPAELFAAVQTDWTFRVPAALAAEARNGAPTYMYEFAWQPPTFGGRLGAVHTLEIPFTFDTLAYDWGVTLRGENAPQSLADEMHGAWVQFAATGDPGWVPYLPQRSVMRFDLESELVTDPRPQQRELWQHLW